MASLEESASDSFIGSSSGGAFLVPKFQIGSIHGKSHYSIEERVFHDDDIPQRAREARKQVAAMTRSDTIKRVVRGLKNKDKPGWRAETQNGYKSGFKIMPWNEGSFNNRYFNEIERKFRVEQARNRLEKIRKGVDPDQDSLRTGPQWNNSTMYQPQKKKRATAETARAPLRAMATYTGKEGDKLGDSVPVAVPIVARSRTADSLEMRSRSYLLKNYKSLTEKQAQLMRQHKLKFAKLEEQKEAASLKDPKASTKKLLGMTLSKMDMTELNKSLQATYDSDALANYMQAMETTTRMEAQTSQETKAFSMGGQQIQASSGGGARGGRSSLKKTAKSTLKSRATAFAVQTAVPNVFESQASARAFPRISKKFGDPVLENREWMQRTSNRSKLLKSGQVTQYFHTGIFSELPAGETADYVEDDLTEEKVGLGRAWSCCMNEDPDSIGCSSRKVSNARRWNYA